MARRRAGAAALVLSGAALAIAGCASDDPADRPAANALTDDVVTVGSFDFAESVLLAEIYSQALERHGIAVERAFGLGPREFVAPAVAVGLIEFVPEYAGSAATFLSRGREIPPTDADATHDMLVTHLEPHPVQALDAAPGENANAFVVTAGTAQRYGLTTLSDVAAVADELTFGGPPECDRRALCLAGLKDVYDIEFGTVVALDPGGPLTKQALRDGGIDIGLLFSSDSSMAGNEFVELVDDEGLQPAENITPLVRDEAVERWGEELVRTADAVSARLTTAELRRLNASFDGGNPAASAAVWLARMGLA
jgi:osmoprotectant transport system substrate-binding protein